MFRFVNPDDGPCLTYDDVQILPQYSEIDSRNECNVNTRFTRNFDIKIPLIAAPMDTVCEEEMATALMIAGGVGCVHRFMSIDEQVRIARNLMLIKVFSPRCFAIGATGDYFERATELVKAGANVLIIDVAHGHHLHVKKAIENLQVLKTKEQPFDIVAGNVAHGSAALDLIMWGADALRVGIGGGSVCETRLRTGIGVPQFDAIRSVYDTARTYDVPVIADGGVRFPGDIAKAIAAGADSVMVGSLFAGTTEAPGEIYVSGQWPKNKTFKMYRGSASATIKIAKNGGAHNVEGAAKMIETKGSVTSVISDVLDGVRSAMSYVGVTELQKLKGATFIRVTQAGFTEATPHLLKE